MCIMIIPLLEFQLCKYTADLVMAEKSKIKNTRNRYNRLTLIYDFIEAPVQFLRMASWREKLRESHNHPCRLTQARWDWLMP